VKLIVHFLDFKRFKSLYLNKKIKVTYMVYICTLSNFKHKSYDKVKVFPICIFKPHDKQSHLIFFIKFVNGF